MLDKILSSLANGAVILVLTAVIGSILFGLYLWATAILFRAGPEFLLGAVLIFILWMIISAAFYITNHD